MLQALDKTLFDSRVPDHSLSVVAAEMNEIDGQCKAVMKVIPGLP